MLIPASRIARHRAGQRFPHTATILRESPTTTKGATKPNYGPAGTVKYRVIETDIERGQESEAGGQTVATTEIKLAHPWNSVLEPTDHLQLADGRIVEIERIQDADPDRSAIYVDVIHKRRPA